MEAGEDEEEAGAEDKNVSKLRRDHGGCYYWWIATCQVYAGLREMCQMYAFANALAIGFKVGFLQNVDKVERICE